MTASAGGEPIGRAPGRANDRVVDVVIGRLRRKLKDNPAAPDHLLTIHGQGYRLLAEGESGSDDEPAPDG